MPSYLLASLSLFPATHDQVLESRKRSAVEWSNGKTVEQYLERDQIMDVQEHASEDRLTTWVLAPRDDPTTLDFMCACETFRRDSIATKKSSPDAPAETENVIGYGIASVFTPASKRKNGYARHMMRLLHWVLASRSGLPAEFPPEWGAPPQPPHFAGNARFSVLYSDVGASLYHNCGPDGNPHTGWTLRGAIHTAWSIDSASNSPSLADTDEWKWLSREDAVALYDRDAQLIRQETANNASLGVSFTFLPDKGVGLFNINRTMLFSRDSLTPLLPADQWGVVLSTDQDVIGSSADTFATWTVDARRGTPPALIVTRLRLKPTMFASLLTKLKEAAQKIGADTLEIWNLPQDLKTEAGKLGGTTVERNDHLPAFKWYGRETDDEVQWIYNEKFCWC